MAIYRKQYVENITISKPETIFLNILSRFMHSTSEESSPLENTEEWESLYKLSVEHHSIPIIYDGLLKINMLDMIPSDLKGMWRKQAIGEMLFQANSTAAFIDVYKEMSKLCDVLVVKGIVCRSLYAMPDYRVSRDEDLFIKKQDFKLCNDFLLQNGFKRDAIDESNLPYEVSYFNPVTGLNIELHTALFSENSSSYGHWNQEFLQAFDNKMEICINDIIIQSLNCTEHLLFLLFHAMKHFLHGGFGIRQLCDIVMFSEKHEHEINWDRIITITKKYNMYVFWMNLMDIAGRYLGFSWDDSFCPKPENVETIDSLDLLSDILQSGIYGKSSNGRMHSANITLKAVSKGDKVSKGVLYSLFPERSYLEGRYPYLKKHGFLLPAAWLHRIINYRKEVKSINKENNDVNSIEIGKQRVELLKKYEIINR